MLTKSVENLEPYYRLSRDVDRQEVYIEAGGLWTAEFFREFQAALYENALPFVQRKLPHRVLADFRSLVTQNREVSELMQSTLKQSVEIGLKRTAVLASSTLFSLQYRRVAEGFEIEFFEDKVEALRWLRS